MFSHLIESSVEVPKPGLAERNMQVCIDLHQPAAMGLPTSKCSGLTVGAPVVRLPASNNGVQRSSGMILSQAVGNREASPPPEVGGNANGGWKASGIAMIASTAREFVAIETGTERESEFESTSGSESGSNEVFDLVAQVLGRNEAVGTDSLIVGPENAGYCPEPNSPPILRNPRC